LRGPAEPLARGSDAATCVSVCRRTVDLVEAHFAARKAAGAAIACAPGCTFCCHQRVGVYAHEAIALLSRLRALASRAEAAAIEARIIANARAIDGMTVEQHRAANVACAFLVDGRCAAYEVRPLACARYHSLSLARCEHAYEHPEDLGTPRAARPVLAELQTLGVAVDEATETSLRGAGLAWMKGELHQLLRALLEDSTLLERWSAGEDIAALARGSKDGRDAGDAEQRPPRAQADALTPS
jgi:Fe-S-cluster containining protein